MQNIITWVVFFMFFLTSHNTKASNLVLTGGHIVNVRKRTIEFRDLYICRGVIVDEVEGKKCSNLKRLDVTGKWLIPALYDMHVHARGQIGGDDDYFRSMSPLAVAKIYIKAGVAGYLDAMQDEKIIFSARDEQRTRRHDEADIFCVGAAFTPTDGHGTEYGLPPTAYRIVDTPNDAIQQIFDIQMKNPDAIKIMYDHRGVNGETIKDGERGDLGVAMKKEVMETLVKMGKDLGIPSYVHVGVWKDARDAIRAGATIINHLGESSIPDDIVALAKEHNVYWIPTLSLYHEYLNIIKQPQLLDDPLLKKITKKKAIASYHPDNIYIDPYYVAYQKRHALDKSSIKKLLKSGVKLVAGSDTVELGTFVGWTLHRELALFVEYGLNEWEALATATINAGDMLGRKFGIESGDVGNVVVLNASPIDNIWNTTRIDKVIHYGRVIP